MRHPTRIFAALPTLALLSQAALPQSPKLEDRLVAARALYYTPTTAGLESFGCKVSIDWKGFLANASGKEIKDDNPALKYLNSVQLTTQDRLRGGGSLEWSSAEAPSGTLQEALMKMKGGVEGMFSGFYQLWNPYLNGSMVPRPDKNTRLTQQDAGIHLHAATGTTSLDEDYDRNMLLTSVDATTESNEVKTTPVYSDTPDGRVIAEIRSEYRQPATAPPTYFNLTVTYQSVGGYRIPAIIRYAIKNVMQTDFNLTDCTINPSEQQTASPGAPSNPGQTTQTFRLSH